MFRNCRLLIGILMLNAGMGATLYGQQLSASDSAWFISMARQTNQYINEDAQRADSYARAYFMRARRLRNDEFSGKGACLVNMSVSLLDPGAAQAWYDTAAFYLLRARNYTWYGYLNKNYGTVLAGQYRFEQGIRYLLISISSFEQAKDTLQLLYAYSNVANVFHDFGNYEKGKEYARLGLAIAARQHDPGDGPQWYLWNVLGINYDEHKEYDQALAAHQSALRFASGNDAWLASTYNNLGNTCKKKGLLVKAEQYFRESFARTKQAQDDYQFATVYGNLGDIALQRKDLVLARRYTDSGLYYARRSGSPEKLKDAYQYSAALYEARGDYKQALSFTRRFRELTDSLESIMKARAVYDAQERYESGKKEKENQSLQRANVLKTAERNNAVFEKKLVLLSSGILILLLSVVAYLLYRIQLSRIRRREDLMLNQALFTGEQNERIRIARDLHDGVGQMLALAKMQLSAVPLPAEALPKSLQLIDETVTEVRNISHNLLPEDLNFGLYAALETMADKITRTGSSTQMEVFIAAAARKLALKKEHELSVYRIVQELCSNMIRHAAASRIRLAVTRQDHQLVFSISDNGKGVELQHLEQAKGIGWKNIKARVHLMGGELKLQPEPLSGTQLDIILPVVP